MNCLKKVKKALVLLICITFLPSCDNESKQIYSTLDSFINSMKSTNNIEFIIKEYCTSDYNKKISKIGDYEKFRYGGIPYAPFVYLKQNANFNFNSLSVLNVTFHSQSDATITMETSTLSIEGPIKKEKGKWYFATGEVFIYIKEGAHKKRLPPEIYLNWYKQSKENWENIEINGAPN